VLAIAAGQVDAVVRPAPVTPVAGTAPWITGVAAVRGRVLPVADLSVLVGVAPDAGDAAVGRGWFVVVDDGRRAAALAGLDVRRVAVRLPDGGGPDRVDAGGEWPGLPLGGVARLEGDSSRGADAPAGAAPLLDVAALLDLVHDPQTDGG
jgi:hypothetical protein